MSKMIDPSEMIERYLQAVRFWLPKSESDRQEGVLAELGEDLRSQVEAKETELGRALNDLEVAAILKRCGVPIVVAGRIGPQQQLIGPTLFPIYKFVMKMVLLWILVPVFLFIVGPANLAEADGKWWLAAASTLGQLWVGLFIAAGIITVVFAVVEYTHAYAGIEQKWDPRTLPPVQKQQERKISRVKSACELGFACFGLIWVLLVPTYPWLILGPAAIFLKGSPMMHPFYIPIVLLSVIGLLRSATILARPQWTAFPLWTQLIQGAITLILLHFLLNAAARPTPASAWHPFVMAREGLQGTANYVGVAAIVNTSILLSLAGTWLGLCIAMAIHAWRLLCYLRKRISGTRQVATMQLQ
jgi:hypothetical protein